MKSKPVVIGLDQTGHVLEPIRPTEKRFSESWLQELLKNHPEILPVDEIESVFWPLTSIGREISTNVGYIDNLFISKSGYLVIVETKLWRNTEAKREVLAQVIDYAAEFSKWSFEQLDEVTQKHNNQGLVELIETAFDLDLDELPTEDLLAKNLRLGRFLILIVGDQIRNSLISMLRYINQYPHLATNVSLVELRCYTMPDNEGEIIVVPQIVAKTEIVERSIVQVNLKPDTSYEVSVEQRKTVTRQERKQPISEDAYWETMQQKSPKSIHPAKIILDHFVNLDAITLRMRKSAIVVRLTIPEFDQRLSLFFIRTDGSLMCWTSTIKTQLQNAGLKVGSGVEYDKAVSDLFDQKSGSFSVQQQVEKMNIDQFVLIVEKFIYQVLESAAPLES